MQYQLVKRYSDFANVHEVCREVLSVSDSVSVQSVLIGGSLLGMIRDGDFLPWDKDLDFAVFENDIERTLALESRYRDLGYECRVHHLGVRCSDDLELGKRLLFKVSQHLSTCNIEHVLIHGALINIVRDGQLFAETDGLSLLLNCEPTQNLICLLQERLQELGTLYINFAENDIKGATLVANGWRVHLHFYCTFQREKEFGWLDLNCEHRFSGPLFPAVTIKIDGLEWPIPLNHEAVLEARFGKKWRSPSVRRFKQGRVPGSMQLFKDGVMFDFIFHYVRAGKTYWFEPAANVISTKGFLPAVIQSTTAGLMRLPKHAHIFLEEHYGDWRTPVKQWDGAVDNPTIIDGNLAMASILKGEKP